MNTSLPCRASLSPNPNDLPVERHDERWAEIVDSLTRRGFISAGMAAAALAACSNHADSGTATTIVGDRWTFVDDRGAQINSPSIPQNIVVYEDFLPAMWERGLRPVGVVASSPLTDNPAIAKTAERLDIKLDSVAALSRVYGEVNLELLTSLEPDLIISWYNFAYPGTYGFVDEDQTIAADLAPFALLDIHSSVPAGAARADQLAVSLGGSTSTEQERQRYQAEYDRLAAIAAQHSGLKITVAIPFPDQVYICGEKYYPLSALLGAAGFVITSVEGQGYMSWETFPTQAGSDILLLSLSPSDDYQTIDEVSADFPTWAAHPAVVAGQAAAIYPNNLPPHWPTIADTLDTLADYFDTVRPL